MAGNSLTIDVQPSDAVSSLKYKLAQQDASLTVERQKLFLVKDDEPVAIEKDTDTLASLGVVAGSQFNVFLEAPEVGKFLRSWGANGSEVGQFTYPWGVAIHSEQRLLFIADIDNHRVQAFRLPSMELAWQFGTSRSKGEKETGLNQPRAVRLSRDGKFVYVADCYNDRIVKLNAADGTFVEQIGGPRGNAIPLLRPQGVSVSDTTDSWVWIADTHNQRVICIDTSLQPPAVVQQIGGTKGLGDNQFRFPTGVTTFEGRVFVADSLNKRVQVLDERSGVLIRSLEVPDTRDVFVDDRSHDAAHPRANLYVSSTTKKGIFVFDARTLEQIGFLDLPAPNANGASCIAVDRQSGELFTPDYARHAVRIFNGY